MTDRILVADDSLTIQKVIKIALSKYSTDVFCINSFLEVQSELKQRSAHLMILDANIPGSQMVDDFKKLKEDFPKLPMLLLAGSYEMIDEEAFKKVGFHHFMKKPFESSDLIKKIAQILGRPLSSQEVPKEAPKEVPKEIAKETIKVDVPSHKPTFTFGNPPPAEEPSPEIDEFRLGFSPPPPPHLVDESLKGKKAFEEITRNILSKRGKEGREDGLPPLPKEIPFDIGDDADVFPDEKKSFKKDMTRELLDEPENSDLESFIPKLKVDFEEFSKNSSSGDVQSVPPINTFKLDEEKKLQPSKDDIEEEIRKAVEDYCKKHFATIAREVLTSELRKLAEERSRHLMDT